MPVPTDPLPPVAGLAVTTLLVPASADPLAPPAPVLPVPALPVATTDAPALPPALAAAAGLTAAAATPEDDEPVAVALGVPPPPAVEPDWTDEVCEAGPVTPDDPPLPVPATLLDTGLAETAPLVPPLAVAPVVDPPVLPVEAFPLAVADEPPLDPPLEPPVVAVTAAGADGSMGREVD